MESEEKERTVSLRQVEANRGNALRSTGPQTRGGKRAVRRNALKHGLLAKEVFIQAGDGKERISEFRNLMAQLREDLQPEGVLEEMLVEKIAICYWRLRRALRSEIGEIRKHLDIAQDKYFEALARHAAGAKYSDSWLHRFGLRDNSFGISVLLGIVAEFRQEVATLGRLTEAGYGELVKYFGQQEGSVANRCLSVAPVAPGESSNTEPEGTAETPTKQKNQILQILDEERRRLEETFYRAEEKEHLELESKLATLNLPSKEAVEKILRYETTIERQLYRAMNQLERLQRMRKGELIPPPMNLEVSSQN